MVSGEWLVVNRENRRNLSIPLTFSRFSRVSRVSRLSRSHASHVLTFSRFSRSTSKTSTFVKTALDAVI